MGVAEPCPAKKFLSNFHFAVAAIRAADFTEVWSAECSIDCRRSRVSGDFFSPSDLILGKNVGTELRALRHGN